MTYPEKYKYTKEHEWIDVQGKTGAIGITHYAQESLGDIVFVDLPKTGSEVKKGQSFGSIESVKAVSEIYAPVSGSVTEVNEELNTTPDKINSDAHSAWLIKVTFADENELGSLMSSADYEKYIAEEGAH